MGNHPQRAVRAACLHPTASWCCVLRNPTPVAPGKRHGAHQVELLKRAGIVWLQPGIESLHSAVLELMDKGLQGWQNVQLLKWCRELGVRLSWNLLWGFPGEEDGWYAEMAEWFPVLEHLQPPGGTSRVRYDRFSPYHKRAQDFGLALRPATAMRHVYPLAEPDLADLAYFFAAEGRPDVLAQSGNLSIPPPPSPAAPRAGSLSARRSPRRSAGRR